MEGEGIRTRSDSSNDHWIFRKVDGVDAIVRIGSIPGVVGEVDGAIINDCRGASVIMYKVSRAVRRRQDILVGTCINDDTATAILRPFLKMINDVRDRINQHIVKHDILL